MHAAVQPHAALGTVEMRRVAGDEEPAVAVAGRDPVVDPVNPLLNDLEALRARDDFRGLRAN